MERLSDLVLKNSLSIGIDESNHGLFPEVFCGVLSRIKKDIQKSSRIIPKEKRNFSRILEQISQRDYSFLVVASKKDYERIGYEKMPGVVAASLLDGIDINFERLNIIFDGELSQKWVEYSKSFVAEVLSIRSKRIYICSGGNFDRTYPLVNLADGMARYLQRQSLNTLARNNHQKHLLA